MSEVLATFFAPLAWLAEPGRNLYWPYLLSAALLSAVVWTALIPVQRGGLLRYLFSRKVWLHPSTLVDLRYWLIDAFVWGSFVAPLVLSSEFVADGVYALLYEAVGTTFPVVAAGWGATLVFTVVVVLAADASFFAAHWLQHRVPVLWEFHRTHHSAQVMTPLTTFRNHPVDQLVSGTLAGLAVGITVGFFDFVHAGRQGVITVWGANLLVFATSLAGGLLRHSHVPLRFGPLDRVFVSPAVHQLHHSALPEHWDRNLGDLFSFWDGWAGTLVLPETGRRYRFGIGDGTEPEYHGVWRLYTWPLVRLLLGNPSIEPGELATSIRSIRASAWKRAEESE